MAGDHKCPLCDSTFTRPQHVGRHLRSHTGDRPYECKECPLRFARSDLLSRHVNKAHTAPEPGAPPKKGAKKGRRKSLPSSARQADTGESSGSGEPGPSQHGQPPTNNGIQAGPGAGTNESARRASFGQQPPQLQAQAMYPNHPLLAGTPPPMPWATAGVNGMTGSPINHFQHGMLGSTPTNATGFNLGMAPGMNWSASDMGASSASMNRNDSGMSSQYEYGVKKRACDQCNHSKVKCDCAHPCNRCTTRSVGCTYNKTPKSRTSSLTPGMSYNGMPNGNSMLPVSTFSTSPHISTSPIALQYSYPNQLQQYTASPTHVGSFALPGAHSQQQPNLGQWTDGNTFDWSRVDPNVPSSASSQALGMYLAPTPVQMQQQHSNGHGVPIAQNYMGQSANNHSISPPARPVLAPTPSLTASHATSPSSSDELAERKSSLISSITSIDYPGLIPVKSHSYSSETSNPALKQASPDAKQYMLPPQAPLEQADLMSYQWQNNAFTIDPRYQIRQSVAQSDDETDTGPNSATFPLSTQADEPLLNGRRRSSVGIWANTFNQMTLQDGSMTNQAMLPDPYTAVQVAHQAANVRPSFPMTTVMEGTEPSKMPSYTDVRDVWKQFIHEPPAGSTPKQEKREGESSQASSASRPSMGRAMSKSNSMPDLTSPSLLAKTFSFNNTNGAEQDLIQHGVASANTQAPAMQHGSTVPASDSTRQTWHNEIQQRQAGFTMQPGGRFGRHSTDASLMLPPSIANRPVASIMQYAGALQQTLAPERAPSFGLTPNIEKPNPTGNGSVLRTPSKLSQRTTLTSATARPGNKRLPSQTLVPEAKKRSASFSVYDEADDGALGDTEDDGTGGAGWNMAAYQNMMAYQNSANYSHHGYVPMPGQGHGRSASLSGIEGWDLSMFGTQPQQGYQSTSAQSQVSGMGMGVPAPMAPASNQM